MALNSLKAPRNMKVSSWQKETGEQVLRSDMVMPSHPVSTEAVEWVLETLDESKIPIPKVVWSTAYGRFILVDPDQSPLLLALISSGREYLRVEVVGDPVLKEKWLLEEETREDAPPEEEDLQ